MSLIGESQGRPDPDHRVPIMIAPQTREDLSRLLYHPMLRGVGYSEFINRAIAAARQELDAK